MATVEQGMNPHTELPQASSTLDFMPSTGAVSSWGGAHDCYGAIWEEASSTTKTDHHIGAEGRVPNSINLMGRMAYSDQNSKIVAAGGFEMQEGNVNWMGAKYRTTNPTRNGRRYNNESIEGSQLGLQFLNPLPHHDSDSAVSSCILQVPAVDEAAPAAAAAHDDHHPLLMIGTHGFLKRDRDHHSSAADHHHHHLHHHPGSPLHKKQRSSVFSTKVQEPSYINTNIEDPAAASCNNGTSSEVGPAVNTNGRPRAKRGSATDPQSVYARQRRERINERLKVLQNLVPNGAKVDIVTMLEEAISYVKFLQLQVKLLSSDEYWMYAPTTYNGIDVSFDMLQHSHS